MRQENAPVISHCTVATTSASQNCDRASSPFLDTIQKTLPEQVNASAT